MKSTCHSPRTTIASWLVLDADADATAFPSVGSNSAAAQFQQVYWQCLVVFFVTARAHNPDLPLVLYANADLATAAPPKVLAALQAVGVAFRYLAISFRLPRGSVSQWGNQFYVLDVIRDFAGTGAASGASDGLLLVDCDCIWRGPADAITAALTRHQCLLYTLAPADQKHYEPGRLINGMSHARMSEIARQEFGLEPDRLVQYHGGEFFAATRAFCQAIQPKVGALWQRAQVEARQPDAIKEEAHFLSIVAEGMGVAPGTANAFIRRIWTNFEDLNVVPDDEQLTLWHLPAEKRFGFRRLWRQLQTSGRDLRSISPREMDRMTSRYMGVPRRTSRKLAQDVAEKVVDRLRNRLLRAG